MQIVIETDEELAEYFRKHNCMNDDGWFSHSAKLLDAFRNGDVLPEEHGPLIDADEYQKKINSVFPCKDRDDTNIRRATEMGLKRLVPIIKAKGGYK